MPAYYNEYEPYAAEWLRNLIKKGLIPDGEVDTRSIVDVRPADLAGFDQCHFFAGIGGWGHALRLAGWPDDRPIWTGSCPCQPFSVAGKGAGTDDPRHLWPHFHRLIAANRPPVVMGEQVAGKAGYGWFDGVRADLEATGYSSRAVDIPALAVNAPHIRQRLYWVAQSMEHANVPHGERSWVSSGVHEKHNQFDGGSAYSHMADASRQRCKRVGLLWDGKSEVSETSGSSEGDMADADQSGRGRRPRDGDGKRDGQAGERHEDHGVAAGGGEDCLDVADANVGQSSEGRRDACEMCGVPIAECKSKDCPALFGGGGSKYGSFWDNHVWLTGSDGKARRARANISLLAHGLSDSMGRMCPEGYAQTVEKVDEYAQKTGQSRTEAMSSVWQIISQEPEAFWPVGECAGVSPQEILLPFLRELSSACDAGGGIGQSEEIQEGEMRGLRDREETARSPHRREPMEQRPSEHSDPMRELSWVLAQHARALWEAYWRANATAYPLLSHGEKNRVGRLRAYGNAIAPPLAAEVIMAFMEATEDA